MELLTTKTILWIIVLQICFFLGTICIFQIQMAELKQVMKEFREEYKTRKTEKSDDMKRKLKVELFIYGVLVALFVVSIVLNTVYITIEKELKERDKQ